MTRTLQPLALPTASRLVVVAPHPDDETLGAGGLIATATGSGGSVLVVLVTDGEQSHPDRPSSEVRRMRMAECRTALDALHPSAVTLLRVRLPDRSVADHFDELVEHLLAVVDAESILVAPHVDDMHRDHVAAALAAQTVARLRGCPLWTYGVWSWERPASSQTRHLELAPTALAAKLAAVAAYRSQTMSSAGRDAVVPADVVEHHLSGHEVFVEELS